jgi:hypothetical protein
MARKLYLGINTICHDPTLTLVPQVISTVKLGEAPGRTRIVGLCYLSNGREKNKMNE